MMGAEQLTLHDTHIGRLSKEKGWGGQGVRKNLHGSITYKCLSAGDWEQEAKLICIHLNVQLFRD